MHFITSLIYGERRQEAVPPGLIQEDPIIAIGSSSREKLKHLSNEKITSLEPGRVQEFAKLVNSLSTKDLQAIGNIDGIYQENVVVPFSRLRSIEQEQIVGFLNELSENLAKNTDYKEALKAAASLLEYSGRLINSSQEGNSRFLPSAPPFELMVPDQALASPSEYQLIDKDSINQLQTLRVKNFATAINSKSRDKEFFCAENRIDSLLDFYFSALPSDHKEKIELLSVFAELENRFCNDLKYLHARESCSKIMQRLTAN